jgi:thiamine-phosphate pyrophosphorylase
MLKNKELRVVDANFNRCKEGLRVVEDIFRFILEDDISRKKIRKIRHALDAIGKEKILKKAILERNSIKDLGKLSDSLEMKRKNCIDVLYVNLQRVKESLRVIEEFFKLISPAKVSHIKKIRYEVYAVEKSILCKHSLA